MLDGGKRTRQRADEKQGSRRRDSAAPTSSSNQNKEEKKRGTGGDIPESSYQIQKRGGHFVRRRRSSNVWGYRYVVVCQWTCYPYSGSHYDWTRSPLHEQGQSASPEKKLKKTQQRQTRTQRWTHE